jgi:MMP 1-O-methyltransferase
MVTVTDERQDGQRFVESDSTLPFFDATENQVWRSMRGFVSTDGAKALYRYAFDSDPQGVAVEIGSLCGRSTVCIARALRDSKKDSRLTAIDIRFQADFWPNLERFGVSDRVEAIQSPSVDVTEAWRKKISFLFIDGAHGKGLAFADLMVWDISLMVGGIMALDDTYGFFVGSTLQLQAAVGSGAYEPLGNIGGISFLRKKGPILADVGDYPMQRGSLISYVDFIGSWIGAMDLEMRLPILPAFPPMTGRKSLKYLTNRILDTSPRAAAQWLAGKLAARRAARQQDDPRTRFLDGISGPITVLKWLEETPALDSPARSTIGYLRACLEIQRLNPRSAIELLQPLCDLDAISMPHYDIEIGQLATLRLAQAYDLAEDRDRAKETYRRLIDGGSIAEIRKQAEVGLSRPFRLPEPVDISNTAYLIDIDLFKYKNLK